MPDAELWPPPAPFDVASLPPHDPQKYRVLVLWNAGKETVYAGLRSDTPLDDRLTGFPLKPSETRVVQLPAAVTSGRVWARTGCKPAPPAADGSEQIVCDTGSCGKPGNPGNAGFDGTPTPVLCGKESAKTCACLAEFTLVQNDVDTYDVSMVDGWNAELTMAPIPGRFAVAHPGKDDPYDSQPASTNLPEGDADRVASWCPAEVLYPSFSERPNAGCLNICKALDRSDMDRVDDATPLTFPNGPDGKPITTTARKWLQLLGTAPAWMHPLRTDATMRDILCCQCGTAPGAECEGHNARWGCDLQAGVCAPGVNVPDDGGVPGCNNACAVVPNAPPPVRSAMWKEAPPPLRPCVAGCTPFNSTYPESWALRRCPVLRTDGRPFDSVPLKPGDDLSVLTNTPEWPLSSLNTRYDAIFKQRSPGAYSWQFDDHKSTFVTRQADYVIVFGRPDKNNPPPQPPSAGLPVWAIVLIAVGSALVVAALLAALFLFARGRGRAARHRRPNGT